MIKKIAFTLLALIVVVILATVIILSRIDLNQFKNEISHAVEKKTGYVLTIDGELRWHIWPRVSLLSNNVSVQEKGALQPVLNADNIRFDIALFSLFSKELKVDNLFIKSGVINITDQSKSKDNSAENTIAVNDHTAVRPKSRAQATTPWALNFKHIKFVDSIIVYQQRQEIINFRSVNLNLTINGDGKGTLALLGSIERDQLNADYNINAVLDTANYPSSLAMQFTKFDVNWIYPSIETPIKSELTGLFNYTASPKRIVTDDLRLNVLESSITGSIDALFDDVPRYNVKLNAKKLNLTPLLASTDDGFEPVSPPTSTAFNSSNVVEENEFRFLTHFDATVELLVDELIINKLILSKLAVQAVNEKGIATIDQLEATVADSTLKVSGRADGHAPKTALDVTASLDNMHLQALSEQTGTLKDIDGIANVDGKFVLHSLSAKPLFNALSGRMQIAVNNVRFNNIDVDTIINSGIISVYKDAVKQNEIKRYTEFKTVTGNAVLANAQLTFSQINAVSDTLNVTGQGWLNLAEKEVDLGLSLTLRDGWTDNQRARSMLQDVTIPLRIYGELNQVNYQLSTEEIIRKQLSTHLDQGLNLLIDKLRRSRK